MAAMRESVAREGNERAELKQAVRERMWTLLEEKRVAVFPGAPGRIQNFVGAEVAARRLGSLPEWRRASVVKATPDAPSSRCRPWR